MRRALCVTVLALGLLAAPSALAGRTPQDFKEPQRMSEEQLEAAKARSKSNLNQFGEVMENKPKPFPWMAFTLAVLCFAIATPFAIRAFRKTSNEIAGANTFGTGARRSEE